MAAFRLSDCCGEAVTVHALVLVDVEVVVAYCAMVVGMAVVFVNDDGSVHDRAFVARSYHEVMTRHRVVRLLD